MLCIDFFVYNILLSLVENLTGNRRAEVWKPKILFRTEGKVYVPEFAVCFHLAVLIRKGMKRLHPLWPESCGLRRLTTSVRRHGTGPCLSSHSPTLIGEYCIRGVASISFPESCQSCRTGEPRLRSSRSCGPCPRRPSRTAVRSAAR